MSGGYTIYGKLCKMDSEDDFKGLVLKGVIPLGRELGRGAYGKVYAVEYCELTCAAKEIHSILIDGVSADERRCIVQSFLKECRQCSELRHPNIIQFLGVYYPSMLDSTSATATQLPVMVMEMMAGSLTSFVKEYHEIPIHIKFSIIHDVAVGLCYLHNHDPSIVHRDLSPNNVLLTAHHVAKISDLGVAKVIKADSKKTMTKVPGTADFMPPEANTPSPKYGTPMDVFSFAGIILHTFNQCWPTPEPERRVDKSTEKVIALSEIERRQEHIDKMTGAGEKLKPLIEKCLNFDPDKRPKITEVCKSIKLTKDAYSKNLKKPLQDPITMYQQLELLKIKTQEKAVIEKEVLVEEKSVKEKLIQSKSKLKTEALPLIPSLISGRYKLKWTHLADLPVPIVDAYVAVQDTKIYVTGDSPSEDALHQVYVYHINADHWDRLKPPGHFLGIPQIVGGKLAIFGGRQSDTKQRTNKVSTFDETRNTWISYYRDMSSVRSKPGIITYLEHVIVAGGDKGEGDKPITQDDIEILNWIENSHWVTVSTRLPAPMFGIKTTVADDRMFIVSYGGVDRKRYNGAYMMPVSNITTSIDQKQSTAKWTELAPTTHYHTALVPGASPPIVVGGKDHSTKGNASTEDIKRYDHSSRTWVTIGLLLHAKSSVAVASVFDNAMIILGGCTKGDTMADVKLSSMTKVELGQVELQTSSN